MKNKFFIFGFLTTLFLFVIFSYAFVDPNLFYLRFLYSGFFSNYREASAIIYIILISLFFLFYGFISLQVYENKIKTNVVMVLIGITLGVTFLSYQAMLSHDIFNYLTTAKVFFFYHENPYVVMPIEFVGEPYLAFTRAANKIALYGPTWLILSGIPYVLGFGNFILTLFNFKLFIAFFYVANGIILSKLKKNTFPLVLFLLNPLVVIETLVSAHNDIVMVFFALLSYYLIQKKKIFIAIIAFILSVLIKYATIMLLPVFVYLVLKTLQKEKINWNKIFSFSGWIMLGVFLLSPLREEFYPWYVIWFFSFAVLVKKKSILFIMSLILTFTTLFRYVPVIYTGSYGGITPLIKEIVTFIPPSIAILILAIRKFVQTYVH